MATTWNPDDKGTGVTLSNGNLTASWSSEWTGVRGTTPKSNGKPFFSELPSSRLVCIGISNASTPLDSRCWSDANQVAYYGGHKVPSDTAYGAEFTNGDEIGVGVDFANNQVTFFKKVEGVFVSQGAITGLPTGSLFPWVCSASSVAVTATINPNPTPIPEGYFAWDAATPKGDQAGQGGL